MSYCPKSSISKTDFAFKTQILCRWHGCVGSQTRKHLGNTEEALTLNVSQLFPRLCAKTTYFEDGEFASWKQKCFASFSFTHPRNIVIKIDPKCFLSNVFWFAVNQMDFTLSLTELTTESHSVCDPFASVDPIRNRGISTLSTLSISTTASSDAMDSDYEDRRESFTGHKQVCYVIPFNIAANNLFKFCILTGISFFF